MLTHLLIDESGSRDLDDRVTYVLKILIVDFGIERNMGEDLLLRSRLEILEKLEVNGGTEVVEAKRDDGIHESALG